MINLHVYQLQNDLFVFFQPKITADNIIGTFENIPVE